MNILEEFKANVTKDIEELESKLESKLELIKEKLVDIPWPPKQGQKCYCINNYEANIFTMLFDDSIESITKLKQCRLHPAREQAEFYIKQLELESQRTYIRFRLHEFAKKINGDWVADYNNKGQVKYNLYINYEKELRLEAWKETKRNALPVFKVKCLGELYKEFTVDEIALLFKVEL